MLDLGDLYQVAVDIRDASGTLVNPAAATLTITLPDGTTVTPAVPIPPALTGKLRVDHTTVQVGRHGYRMVTTGPATVYTGIFDVRPEVPELLVSLEDAKAHLNITSSVDDEELRSMIEGMTGPVERYAGAVVRRSVSETFDGGRCAVLLSRIPVVSVTSVVDSGTVLDPSSYKVDRTSGIVTRVAGVSPLPFLAGVQSVQVAYVAGQSIVPPNVRAAALIILQHMWETQRPAAAGPFSQGGDDYDPRYTYSIPRRALELLGEPIGGIA